MQSKNWRTGISIRIAFIGIFSILLAVPLILFYVWPISKAMENELEQVKGKHLLIAQNLGSALERYHSDVITTFEYYVEKSTRFPATDISTTLLTNLNFRHICIADPISGRVLSGYGELIAKCPKIVPPKRLAMFKDLAVEGKTIMSGVVKGPHDKPIIFLVHAKNGFYVIGALNTDYIVQLGKQISFGVKGHAAIVDQHGRVLAHPLDSWIAAIKDISKISTVRRMLAGETGVQIFFSPALKDDMIAGFAAVKGPGWGVMIPQPLKELKDAAKEIQWSAIYIFAIGIIIAFFVSVLATLPILRPLSAAVEGAKRMGQGHTNTRLNLGYRFIPRELYSLLTSFNKMAENVSSAEKELTDHRDNLQTQVDEATSELKIQAAELQEALKKEKELSALQRQFVSMVSHEFRTPLALIDSSAQLIKRRAHSITPCETIEKIESIRAAIQRMTRLLESTLTASMLDEGRININVKECRVDKVLTEICSNHQRLTSEHKIDCKFGELPTTMTADAAALEQIFNNLLSNAIKYSPDSSLIEVFAEQDDDQIVIQVRDFGLGIDEDDLPNMFGRYFRAKTSAGIAGTGIGLNLARVFVELHGGSINVRSTKGEGSIFTIRLPISGPNQNPVADNLAA